MSEENELRQAEYAANRRANAIRLGINSAIHGVTNISIFTDKTFWSVVEQPIMDNIKHDSINILADLMLLKAKIESVIGQEKQMEKE
jgi:hypothetical protein